jgi:hypothetical protein
MSYCEDCEYKNIILKWQWFDDKFDLITEREQPQIEIWPQGEQAVTLGSPFELRCRVQAGVPEPDVTWSRNGGRPLSSLAQIQPNNILRYFYGLIM